MSNRAGFPGRRYEWPFEERLPGERAMLTFFGGWVWFCCITAIVGFALLVTHV